MPSIETIYLKNGKLRVHVRYLPSGEDWIEVELPKDFSDCIYKLVELEANKAQQLMRAQILADAAKEIPK